MKEQEQEKTKNMKKKTSIPKPDSSFFSQRSRIVLDAWHLNITQKDDQIDWENKKSNNKQTKIDYKRKYISNVVLYTTKTYTQ